MEKIRSRLSLISKIDKQRSKKKTKERLTKKRDKLVEGINKA
jgi:hypothetical protein